MQVLLGWIRNGHLWMVHLAPPCSFFSLAPDERKRARLKSSGLRCARAALRILRACKKCGINWTVENPMGSRIWTWPPLHSFLRTCQSFAHGLDYCEFGMHFKKPTMFCSNREEFHNISLQCAGGHYHDRLAGTVRVDSKWRGDGKAATVGHTVSRWRTSLACAYPCRLAHSYAAILRSIAPPHALRVDGLGAAARRQLGRTAPDRAVVRLSLRTRTLRAAAGVCARTCSETGSCRDSSATIDWCPKSEGRRWPASAPSWGSVTSWTVARGRRPLYYPRVEARDRWPSARDCSGP